MHICQIRLRALEPVGLIDAYSCCMVMIAYLRAIACLHDMVCDPVIYLRRRQQHNRTPVANFVIEW